MDEQQKAATIELTGTARHVAIERFSQQLQQWQLAMPPAEPLVLDFGLGDFARFGLIEYWIANEIEAGYCGKYLFVFDGQSCPMHHHLDKHETFFIVKGAVTMELEGSNRRLDAGDVLPMQCGVRHGFTGLGPALILEVSRPCVIADNYFVDEQIPIGGNYHGDKK